MSGMDSTNNEMPGDPVVQLRDPVVQPRNTLGSSSNIPVPRAHCGSGPDNTHNEISDIHRTIPVPRAHCGSGPDNDDNEIPDTHRTVPVPRAYCGSGPDPRGSEIAADLNRVAIIGQKRKAIEDNINLTTNAVIDMIPMLNDIKQQYDDITRLESALGLNKKRLKKCREEIMRKVESYRDAVSSYIDEKNKFLAELNDLSNKFDGSSVKRAATLKEISTKEIVKLKTINQTQLSQTIRLVNQTKL